MRENGAHREQARERLHEPHAGVLCLDVLKLDVRLVEQHVDVRRAAAPAGPRVARTGMYVPVGSFGLHSTSTRVRSPTDRAECIRVEDPSVEVMPGSTTFAPARVASVL